MPIDFNDIPDGLCSSVIRPSRSRLASHPTPEEFDYVRRLGSEWPGAVSELTERFLGHRSEDISADEIESILRDFGWVFDRLRNCWCAPGAGPEFRGFHRAEALHATYQLLGTQSFIDHHPALALAFERVGPGIYQHRGTGRFAYTTEARFNGRMLPPDWTRRHMVNAKPKEQETKEEQEIAMATNTKPQNETPAGGFWAQTFARMKEGAQIGGQIALSRAAAKGLAEGLAKAGVPRAALDHPASMALLQVATPFAIQGLAAMMPGKVPASLVRLAGRMQVTTAATVTAEVADKVANVVLGPITRAIAAFDPKQLEGADEDVSEFTVVQDDQVQEEAAEVEQC